MSATHDWNVISDTQSLKSTLVFLVDAEQEAWKIVNKRRQRIQIASHARNVSIKRTSHVTALVVPRHRAKVRTSVPRRGLRKASLGLRQRNDDLTLKSQCEMPSALADEIDTQFNVFFSTSGILVVFWRSPFCVSCVVTAIACSRFLRRRLPQDPSRNVLFSGARMLISDFTWLSLRRDPPSAV